MARGSRTGKVIEHRTIFNFQAQRCERSQSSQTRTWGMKTYSVHRTVSLASRCRALWPNIVHLSIWTERGWLFLTGPVLIVNLPLPRSCKSRLKLIKADLHSFQSPTPYSAHFELRPLDSRQLRPVLATQYFVRTRSVVPGHNGRQPYCLDSKVGNSVEGELPLELDPLGENSATRKSPSSSAPLKRRTCASDRGIRPMRRFG